MAVFRRFAANISETAGELPARQIELPLRVAVCAWCKPRGPRDGAGAISHGICLRHLREMKLQLRGAFPPRRPHRRKRQSQTATGLMLLPL